MTLNLRNLITTKKVSRKLKPDAKSTAHYKMTFKYTMYDCPYFIVIELMYNRVGIHNVL